MIRISCLNRLDIVFDIWKQIIVLLILGSVTGSVAVKGAERMGAHSPPYLLSFIWVSDALTVCVALWQIKRLNKIPN
jgi:hypothetical protein